MPATINNLDSFSERLGRGANKLATKIFEYTEVQGLINQRKQRALLNSKAVTTIKNTIKKLDHYNFEGSNLTLFAKNLLTKHVDLLMAYFDSHPEKAKKIKTLEIVSNDSLLKVKLSKNLTGLEEVSLAGNPRLLAFDAPEELVNLRKVYLHSNDQFSISQENLDALCNAENTPATLRTTLKNIGLIQRPATATEKAQSFFFLTIAIPAILAVIAIGLAVVAVAIMVVLTIKLLQMAKKGLISAFQSIFGKNNNEAAGNRPAEYLVLDDGLQAAARQPVVTSTEAAKITAQQPKPAITPLANARAATPPATEMEEFTLVPIYRHEQPFEFYGPENDTRSETSEETIETYWDEDDGFRHTEGMGKSPELHKESKNQVTPMYNNLATNRGNNGLLEEIRRPTFRLRHITM